MMRRIGNGSLPSRRSFLQGASALTLGALASPSLVGRAFAGGRPDWSKGNPFSLGVASGAPSADGFVLWTRLVPDPLSTDPAMPGGMSGGTVPVGYEIAEDEAMTRLVRKGIATAEPRFAWSVHEVVGGLKPGRPYWYRFTSGDASSRVGRAMTLPAPGTTLDRLRFAFASCSNYEHGYYASYRHLADEHPDLVIFLGDYIYESIDTKHPIVRKHSDGVEARTLRQYRNRYTQYKLDESLQRVHAVAPSLATWDDHEVQNDYAGEWSPSFEDPAKFLLRRAAAYQAFYEHMPVRPALSTPHGPSMRLYDRFAFGDLVRISMIDGRQYRSREACYGPPNKGGGHLETDASCPERLSATRSMMGTTQEKWLYDGLSGSKARWNVIAQDVLMAKFAQKDETGQTAYWVEDWNGYPANRTRLLQHIHDAHVDNAVVIGGDSHCFWTNDLKPDFDDPRSPTVATEFVGTSISSRPPPYELFATALPENPHVRFFESRKRGYVSVDLDARRMTTKLQAISDVTDPNATLSTLKTFVVESGRPGAVEA